MNKMTECSICSLELEELETQTCSLCEQTYHLVCYFDSSSLAREVKLKKESSSKSQSVSGKKQSPIKVEEIGGEIECEACHHVMLQNKNLKKKLEPSCFICGESGSEPLKECKENVFCHVRCALTSPAVQIGSYKHFDVEDLSKNKGKEGKCCKCGNKSHHLVTCRICGDKSHFTCLESDENYVGLNPKNNLKENILLKIVEEEKMFSLILVPIRSYIKKLSSATEPCFAICEKETKLYCWCFCGNSEINDEEKNPSIICDGCFRYVHLSCTGMSDPSQIEDYSCPGCINGEKYESNFVFPELIIDMFRLETAEFEYQDLKIIDSSPFTISKKLRENLKKQEDKVMRYLAIKTINQVITNQKRSSTDHKLLKQLLTFVTNSEDPKTQTEIYTKLIENVEPEFMSVFSKISFPMNSSSELMEVIEIVEEPLKEKKIETIQSERTNSIIDRILEKTRKKAAERNFEEEKSSSRKNEHVSEKITSKVQNFAVSQTKPPSVTNNSPSQTNQMVEEIEIENGNEINLENENELIEESDSEINIRLDSEHCSETVQKDNEIIIEDENPLENEQELKQVEKENEVITKLQESLNKFQSIFNEINEIEKIDIDFNKDSDKKENILGQIDNVYNILVNLRLIFSENLSMLEQIKERIKEIGLKVQENFGKNQETIEENQEIRGNESNMNLLFFSMIFCEIYNPKNENKILRKMLEMILLPFVEEQDIRILEELKESKPELSSIQRNEQQNHEMEIEPNGEIFWWPYILDSLKVKVKRNIEKKEPPQEKIEIEIMEEENTPLTLISKILENRQTNPKVLHHTKKRITALPKVTKNGQKEKKIKILYQWSMLSKRVYFGFEKKKLSISGIIQAMKLMKICGYPQNNLKRKLDRLFPNASKIDSLLKKLKSCEKIERAPMSNELYYFLNKPTLTEVRESYKIIRDNENIEMWAELERFELEPFLEKGEKLKDILQPLLSIDFEDENASNQVVKDLYIGEKNNLRKDYNDLPFTIFNVREHYKLLSIFIQIETASRIKMWNSKKEEFCKEESELVEKLNLVMSKAKELEKFRNLKLEDIFSNKELEKFIFEHEIVTSFDKNKFLRNHVERNKKWVFTANCLKDGKMDLLKYEEFCKLENKIKKSIFNHSEILSEIFVPVREDLKDVITDLQSIVPYCKEIQNNVTSKENIYNPQSNIYQRVKELIVKDLSLRIYERDCDILKSLTTILQKLNRKGNLDTKNHLKEFEDLYRNASPYIHDTKMFSELLFKLFDRFIEIFKEESIQKDILENEQIYKRINRLYNMFDLMADCSQLPENKKRSEALKKLLDHFLNVN